MNSLQGSISRTLSYKKVRNSFEVRDIHVIGAGITEKALIVASLCEEKDMGCVFVAGNELKALSLYNELMNYYPEDVVYLSPKELLLYRVEARSHENEYSRIRVLYRLLKGAFRIAVIPVRALADIICNAEKLIRASFSITPGMEFEIDNLISRLSDIGYKREMLVEGPGQFARRGGIVDLFPVNLDDPIRIEFFGDYVDSMRIFDPMTQRSLHNLDQTDILPSREVLLDASEKLRLAEKIKAEPGIERSEDIEKLEQNIYINGIDRYIDLIAEEKKSILENIHDCFLCMDDVEHFEEEYTAIVNETNEEIRNLFRNKVISANMAEIINDMARSQIHMDRFRKISFGNLERSGYGDALHFDSRAIPSYKGDINVLKQDLNSWIEKGYEINVAVSSEEKGKRLVDLLEEPSKVRIVTANLSNGFEMPKDRIVVISEKTIFKPLTKKREFSYKDKNIKKISAFSDIRKGDLIVHRVHGIGIYEGIEQLVVENVKKDYIKIRYRDEGILYIPTEQLDAIQKYIGSDEKRARINKLGTNEWANTKKRVKESLMELARDLVELYAKRLEINGYLYSADTPWQKEFEDKFPFEETEDQLVCAEEIKKDMEKDTPMDRILCGDVGYGKTEVAIRAMFKAVNDDFQVAYLVPTTVLAQQQYNNFIERFADYPIKIEMLSRFRTPMQQKEIVKKTKKGQIDILIATHRMLSKDTAFKNLGLLVVDEEHRFGVKHKEKIKERYPRVDVLTLTATPIPRTLHMSMVGIRDISVIEMPPKERYPVQTFVMEFDEDIIRNAIYREMAREGQIFYIHNRVRDMDLKKDQLQKIVPEAVIEISHGQMSERELERIMEDFENKMIDVLLCTTIIESGLDISNANTIIVEDSQNFGLAQLYQLKGRVGRSDRHAYAYITYKKDRVLNEAAEKRLAAIREFTEFGAGFKIALRDLEIRGAGNILGAEQHGQMDAVGYEMYCRLLDEAVSETRGIKAAKTEDEVKLEIKVSAYIDDRYIPDLDQKIEIYKRIAEIETHEDLMDVKDEVLDRYGELPEDAANLIEIAYIRHMAAKLGFVNIKQGKEEIIFKYGDPDHVDLRIIAKLGDELKKRVMFTPSANPYITMKCGGLDKKNILDNIKVLLHLIIKLKRDT